MGGTPHSCVDVLALPDDLPAFVPGEILNGAVEKVTEAGAVLVGGHTINDKELKFGLAVTGTVHPDKIVTNAGAKAGDVLVLTKPLGSGFLCTAIKREDLDERETLRSWRSMATLNRGGERGDGRGRRPRRHRHHGLRAARPRLRDGGRGRASRSASAATRSRAWRASRPT